MINFRFSAANHLLSELRLLVVTSNTNREWVQTVGTESGVLETPKNKESLADCRKSALSCTDMSKRFFGERKCIHIDMATANLQRWAEDEESNNWHELNIRARALRDAIERELREYYFYQYPKDKSKTILSWETDWVGCISYFPLTKLDVLSAVDCYARRIKRCRLLCSTYSAL
jgi:hypothetical protein